MRTRSGETLVVDIGEVGVYGWNARGRRKWGWLSIQEDMSVELLRCFLIYMYVYLVASYNS